MQKITYGNYEEDSWETWEQSYDNDGSLISDAGTRGYLPSPSEIEERKAMLRWLHDHKFPLYAVDSIMLYDTPTFDEVVNSVNEIGVPLTLSWIRRTIKALKR